MAPRSPPPAPPSFSTTARTVHAFLVASTLIIASGGFVVTKSMRALSGDVTAIDGAALLMGGSALCVALLLRTRMPDRGAAASLDDWWKVSLGRAVLIWALFEMPAAIGAVALFLTGHVASFAVLVLLGVAGLLTAGPRRLAGN